MTIPITAVINPPLTKLICFGDKFAKSFAGETTFAVIYRRTIETQIPAEIGSVF